MTTEVPARDRRSHHACVDTSCDPLIAKRVETEAQVVEQNNKIYGDARMDCFIKNYNQFKIQSKYNPYLNLAIIDIRYTKSGKEIRHCVMYDGDTLIDVSQGYRLQADRLLVEQGAIGAEYIIKEYIYWNKDNIPSLKVILNEFGCHDSTSRGMIKGALPQLKGRWDHAKDSIINL